MDGSTLFIHCHRRLLLLRRSFDCLGGARPSRRNVVRLFVGDDEPRSRTGIDRSLIMSASFLASSCAISLLRAVAKAMMMVKEDCDNLGSD